MSTDMSRHMSRSMSRYMSRYISMYMSIHMSRTPVYTIFMSTHYINVHTHVVEPMSVTQVTFNAPTIYALLTYCRCIDIETDMSIDMLIDMCVWPCM